jgi:hypothetical protein
MAITTSFTIGGANYKAKSIKYNWESLASEDSGRTLDGVMHINWIFSNIRKLEIVMPPCDASTIQSIINKVQGKEYSMSYFDPAYGGTVSKTFYTSNSHADMYSGVIKNGL